jgi:23S rRNA (guanosine2251-2'-O)-methyltransferase
MNREKKTMAELDRIDVSAYREMQKIPVFVVLDNVRSAHNVGSIFRSCDAFRVSKVFLCGITPVPPNAEIHKTALGATESVQWEYVESTSDVVSRLKRNGIKVYSVEQTANSIGLCDIKKEEKGFALIFGHEVYGVDQRIVDISDACLEIQQFGTKHSLNVSVCAGIVICSMANLYGLMP